MYKKRGFFLVILIMFLVFNVAATIHRLEPVVEATYVNGAITQNTDWTMVDSPFIVSNDIVVYPNATLTIEPGVQVRFGDNFSVTVNGAIIADGTQDRNIVFTSNNINPRQGRWGTIHVDTTQECSITNCTIEYGQSGVTVNNGALNLQDDVVSLNGNGVVVNGGDTVIENSQINNNTMDGVNINGSAQVTVQNNVINSNGNGIDISGYLTETISISQNNLTSNSQSGVLLEGNEYDDLVITRNNISFNDFGFQITGNASSYITENYISNNTDGIYYSGGNGHIAYSNDIFNNAVGLDAAPTASVNATYNYWGDETGPFHASLNPNGKGNPVTGNGINVDFIFFLTKPIDFSNMPPTAVLQTDKSTVAPNETVTFIGTNSYDDGQVDQYYYDFGDGAASGWTTLSLLNHTYTNPGTYNAILTVMDDFGSISQNPASATISVIDLPALNVSTTLSSPTTSIYGNITITVSVSDQSGAAVGSAAVNLIALRGGSFSPASGTTDSSGQFVTKFTAPNVTDTSQVRLIVTASELGYADGSTYTFVQILPSLNIELSGTEPSIIKSEANATVIFSITGGRDQPVPQASVATDAEIGTLWTNTGVTDINGTVTFNYTAPSTLIPLNVTFTTTASETGFTNGQDEETITILPNTLAVALTVNQPTIISEGNTTVTALVTCDANPIPGANVTLSSGNGSFAPINKITDSNGLANFLFSASQTVSPLNAIISATATKSKYVDGTGQTTITIMPKVLTLQLTTGNYTTVSEDNTTLTARVTYNLAPVQGANITMTSNNGGTFAQSTETTDTGGIATFVFTAPIANQSSTIVTLTAECAKEGFADVVDQAEISIVTGNITVQLFSSTYTADAGSTVVLTVVAQADSRPVTGANVTISASEGSFSSVTGMTDTNGTYSFLYNAPSATTEQSIMIIANATKNGYSGNSIQTRIAVNPVEVRQTQGGFPVWIMLLIIIPVIFALVIVLLIKFKVIVVTTDTENME